jgi:alpha-ketoglutarate-dependent taurine dioxygenase
MVPTHVIDPLAVGSLATSTELRQVIIDDVTRHGATVLYGIDPSMPSAILDVARLIGSIDLNIELDLSGPPIMEIRFNAVKAQKVRRQEYFTSDEFSLHTDLSYVINPPRYLLMHCVQPDPDGGGASLLADCRAAFGVISNEGRSVLSREIFKFGYPLSYPLGGSRTQPIHETSGTREIWRYRLDRLQYPAWAKSAINEFDEALRSTVVSHLLDAGDLLVIDNHRTAHGRTAFRPDMERNQRHLRRSYAHDHNH